MKDKMVVVGRIGAAHGIKGWVRINSFTQPRDKLLDYVPWYVMQDNEWQIFEVKETHIHGNEILARFVDCEDRNGAQALTGFSIAISREQLPELDDDEYYWTDLEGLNVVTTQGHELGIVDHLFTTGSNDVLVVKGEKQHLIPYLRDVIMDVNLTTRMITVNWDPEF